MEDGNKESGRERKKGRRGRQTMGRVKWKRVRKTEREGWIYGRETGEKRVGKNGRGSEWAVHMETGRWRSRVYGLWPDMSQQI